MKTIYLHIGANKTGSSAIQAFLVRNKEKLQQQGYHVLRQTHDNAHYYLSNAFGYGPPLKGVDKERAINETISEIESSGCKNTIISSEYFILSKSPQKIRKAFASYNVKIIIYLRRHDLWFESLYKQAVKTVPRVEWEKGIDGYIKYVEQKKSQELSYKKLIMLWEEAFGKENLIIRPYEKESFRSGSLNRDFATVIGANDGPLEDSGHVVNKSFPVQYVDIYENMKRHEKLKPEELLNVMKWMLKQEDDKSYSLFDDIQRQDIINQNIADYKFLAERYKMDCPNLFINYEAGFGRKKIPNFSVPRLFRLVCRMAQDAA